MLSQVIEFLNCPVCGAELRLAGSAVRCGANHCFDLARQGYVNLLAGAGVPGTADTAEMVEARERFLSAGHFDPLRKALAERARALASEGLVVDAGAGVGTYLCAVVEAIEGARGLALDISKFALRRAARKHPRIGAVVWDLWRPLPVRTGSAALVLNVFAPRNGAEFRRILRHDGALLVVTPTARHLQELVSSLGLLSVDEQKEARLAESLAPFFALERRDELEFPMSLHHGDLETVARMGPSAHHLDNDALVTRIAALAEPLPVTASFTLSVYRPRS